LDTEQRVAFGFKNKMAVATQQGFQELAEKFSQNPRNWKIAHQLLKLIRTKGLPEPELVLNLGTFLIT
jgi:hypothetical protein